ncbi:MULTISPECIES: hypothetical protein [unclassified Thiocapsa]|uniref:hypothetical protein n=1 Tax=unclassified Thiocapsa TaxID=2641286 RepID=UPI0035ADC97B
MPRIPMNPIPTPALLRRALFWLAAMLFVAAKNMFLLLDGWQLAGAALMVAVPAILL